MKKETKKYYLTCKIDEGMFSNEKIVSFQDINNRDISGFWPSDCTKENKLEVRIDTEEKDRVLIRGPFAASGSYGFWQGNSFWVNGNLLSYE